MMRLYNTLTRAVEDFTSLHDNTVTMYSCGPTVYDHAHIGNLASFIAADTLKRALLASGYTVKHVMNITDIDDKTIRRSHDQYPDLKPMEALVKSTRSYEELFRQDITRLGIDVNSIQFVRATESIDDMQKLIIELHKSGIAYLADKGVYFSIEAYKKKARAYGQLVEVTAESTGAARVDNDEYDKDSIHDFALWKTQKESEPAWPFQLEGKDLTGRPGWHIECSAMSTTALGQPYDIHTGGVDLKFPHHENEIAQSTGASDETRLARFFVHNEHLLVDGRKMSKSLGNFYTLESVVDKGYDPLAFRLLVLQSHYQSQMNFSWDLLDAATNRLQILRALAVLRYQNTDNDNGADEHELDYFKESLGKALSDDLNTPEALATLSSLETLVTKQGLAENGREAFVSLLAYVDDVLGLDMSSQPDISDSQKQLIAEREKARDAKDWAKSDELRDKLAEQGILLNDTDRGPIWSRC